MSYLASLARPAAVGASATLPRVAGKERSETLREEHREVEAVQPSAAAAPPVDRSSAAATPASRDMPTERRPGPAAQATPEPASAPPRMPAAPAGEAAHEVRASAPAVRVAAPLDIAVAVRAPEPAFVPSAPALHDLPTKPLSRPQAEAASPARPAQAPDELAPAPPRTGHRVSRPAEPTRLVPSRLLSGDEPGPLPVAPRDVGVARAGNATDRVVPARRDRGVTQLHIGSIALTVKVPAPPAPVPAAAPAAVVPVAAPPAAAAAPVRPREGLGFSASRHYLRWS